jgi:hypothetical protein
MGRIKKPLPGKLILSAIFSSHEAALEAVKDIEKKYGRIEYESDIMPFLHTTYYREEMGDDLQRKFFAFKDNIERDRLPEIKLFTNKVEAKYGEKVDDYIFRKVNLDPGILTLANLTLASTKDFAHRIYLREGIFGETTLIYERGKFRTLPWTYPDYAEPEVLEILTKARDTLKGLQFDL